MTLNDQITPELLRIRKELEALNKCTIHVGIQGDADSEILTIARVHEYGAVIHAKNVKNLCIPIHKMSYDKSPRDFENDGLFFFTSHNGFTLAAIPTNKRAKKPRGESGVPVEKKPRKSSGKKKEKIKTEDDEIIILFLLLPSVTIPERSFIRAGYDANRDRLAEECEKVVGKIIFEGWGWEKAAEWLGGKAVDFIHEYMTDSGNFKAKGPIQQERAPSWANSPLVVTKRMFNSITWKVEGGAE